MRGAFLAVLAALAWLAGADPARAEWSAPRTIHASPYATTAVAVNQSGEAAVAWAEREPTLQRPGTAVHLFLRRPDGRTRTRTIWTSRRAVIGGGVSVAIDRRGEVTVAWVAGPGRRGREVVWAAFGSFGGRWARPHVVGAGLPDPRLAVAPDRRVLLAWPAGRSRPAVAWRRPGHRFAAPTRLSRPRLTTLVYIPTDVVPAFDAGGTAYLTSECDGVVVVARPGSLRFGTPIELAPGRVLGFSLSVSAAGRGLATWIDGQCTQDVSAGDTPGPVLSSVLAAGHFGARRELASTAYAMGTIAVAAPDGSGSASWSELGPTDSGVFTRPLHADGSFGPAQRDGMVPFAATGGGDQLITQALFAAPPAVSGPGGLSVRPKGGGADQRAPAVGQVAVSAPLGRRAAVVWNASPYGGDLELSVWRP